MFHKPIERNDQTSSPNFEFPVFEAEEDDVKGIPDGISRLLEREKKITQLRLENQQNSQLGHIKKFRIQTRQIIMQMKILILFLFLRFYVITNFMQKTKRENNWKNKYLTCIYCMKI